MPREIASLSLNKLSQLVNLSINTRHALNSYCYYYYRYGSALPIDFRYGSPFKCNHKVKYSGEADFSVVSIRTFVVKIRREEDLNDNVLKDRKAEVFASGLRGGREKGSFLSTLDESPEFWEKVTRVGNCTFLRILLKEREREEITWEGGGCCRFLGSPAYEALDDSLCAKRGCGSRRTWKGWTEMSRDGFFPCFIPFVSKSSVREGVCFQLW